MEKQIAVFGGGCFWCTEAIFQELKGVVSVMPGYAGGTVTDPTYEQVCGGKTGHAEVTKIEFDPSQISYTDLLKVFFYVHDPTTLDRQGSDIGPQYRSIILYADEEQKEEASRIIDGLKKDGQNIVTELKPLAEFYPAEEYHHNFYKNNLDKPYCQIIIDPKIKKFEEHFKQLLK